MIPAWVKGTLLLTLTLVGGIAIGRSYERGRASSHAAGGVRHLLPHLTERLDLDAAQQTAIAAILARRQAAVDSTWHVVQPHVRATMDSTLREILVVLRPDQVETYRRMMETRHPGSLPHVP